MRASITLKSCFCFSCGMFAITYSRSVIFLSLTSNAGIFPTPATEVAFSKILESFSSDFIIFYKAFSMFFKSVSIAFIVALEYFL